MVLIQTLRLEKELAAKGVLGEARTSSNMFFFSFQCNCFYQHIAPFLPKTKFEGEFFFFSLLFFISVGFND